MSLKQYRLYLDECGTEDYSNLDQLNGRFLSLVGVVMDQALVPAASTNMDTIKNEFFARHPDDPLVIFHRTDMMKFRGPFQVLRDDTTRARFDRWWLRYLQVTPYTVICVVIDKRAMQKKQRWVLKHPYHYGMAVLAEKYALFLNSVDAHGDIMPESRGKKDVPLQASFDEVRANGTYYVAPGLLQKRLPANVLKFRSKPDNITGLQICDSIAKAAQEYALLHRKEIASVSAFTGQIHRLIDPGKFYRGLPPEQRLWGYGLKYIP